jgi:oligoendopeptidase F
MLKLPATAQEFMRLSWDEILPFYQTLAATPLTEASCEGWLKEWTRLSDQVNESLARLQVANNLNTADEKTEKQYHTYLDEIHLPAQAQEHQLKMKLLASGLEPDNMHNPLRKMRAETDLFREENLPLISAEKKLGTSYDKIIGAQTVAWNGEEATLQKLRPVFYQDDRTLREKAWRLAAERQLQDREGINALWKDQLEVRRQLAENAGKTDYRAYRWQQQLRLDYTPEDCAILRDSIEKVAVPAATRIYEKHRQNLGLDSLRPWDIDLDLYPVEHPRLPSYGSGADLLEIGDRVFPRLDPQLGAYYASMRQENLLDVENRKGKAPGAYCVYFPATQKPFIFANGVGLFSDIRTLLHECGHAFHNFEIRVLPYAQQRRPGLEFSEVASMSMELLSMPYWEREQGGFYPADEARRAKIAQLERILVFWPYMAVVDAFQHWVYLHVDEAVNPDNCNRVWLELWERFIPGVDWSGLEDMAATGWHRKQHIHRAPFYYVEYGLAQLGAVQVWRNALQDQAAAVADYRRALALGGTRTLPELFSAAGARFAFDAETLGEAVALIEREIDKLTPV